VFLNGRLQHVDAVAVGGRHVTTDLARGLSMRMEDAERLKCLAATCVDDPATMRDLITIPKLGDDERAVPEALSRLEITRIVRPRVEEILELLRDRLRNAGFGSILNRGVVLTGGASQLAGLQTLAQGTLSKQVRFGRPLIVKGMPESANSPAFAAATGLLIYPQMAGLEHIAMRRGSGAEADPSSGYIARVGRWLRDSF
jgi:cell division protein FtsA